MPLASFGLQNFSFIIQYNNDTQVRCKSAANEKWIFLARAARTKLLEHCGEVRGAIWRAAGRSVKEDAVFKPIFHGEASMCVGKCVLSRGYHRNIFVVQIFRMWIDRVDMFLHPHGRVVCRPSNFLRYRNERVKLFDPCV